MSRTIQTRRSSEHGASDAAGSARVAPGKVTLTSRLPGREERAVQRKAPPAGGDTGAGQARTTWDWSSDPWLDAALRGVPPVQCKANQADGHAGPAPSASGPGTALPAAVQARMEQAFATDFSAVRVHEGAQAGALGALAYTQGTDIHFAPGQYRPDSLRGQELLGHELAHVVQQAEGRVAAARQMKGVSINDDPALEREADILGAEAARGGRVAAPGATVQRAAAPGVVQRMVLKLGASDEGIDKDAVNIQKVAGGALETSIGQVAGIQNNEELHIVAHLEAGKIGAMDPGALAAAVAPHLLGKAGITVILHACFAANPKALEEDPDDLWSSYAGQFQQALSAGAGWMVPVEASLGAEYTSSSGQSRVRQGHVSHAELDEHVDRETRRLPKKAQKQRAEQLTNEIIEGGSNYGQPFFLDENQGRLRFLDRKRDDIEPMAGSFEDDDYNNPEKYEIVE